MKGSDELSFVLLAFFGGILFGLWRLLKKFFWHYDEAVKVQRKKKKSGKGSERFVKKEFFIKSLCRRRRLDVTRKGDNIMSGGLAKKIKKHRRGMFGK